MSRLRLKLAIGVAVRGGGGDHGGGDRRRPREAPDVARRATRRCPPSRPPAAASSARRSTATRTRSSTRSRTAASRAARHAVAHPLRAGGRQRRHRVFLCSNLGNGPAGTPALPAVGHVTGTITPETRSTAAVPAQGLAPRASSTSWCARCAPGATYANVHSRPGPAARSAGRSRTARTTDCSGDGRASLLRHACLRHRLRRERPRRRRARRVPPPQHGCGRQPRRPLPRARRRGAGARGAVAPRALRDHGVPGRRDRPRLVRVGRVRAAQGHAPGRERHADHPRRRACEPTRAGGEPPAAAPPRIARARGT